MSLHRIFGWLYIQHEVVLIDKPCFTGWPEMRQCQNAKGLILTVADLLALSHVGVDPTQTNNISVILYMFALRC